MNVVLDAALNEYLARKKGSSRPSGNYRYPDHYWRPDQDEVRDCCGQVMPQSYKYPGLYGHCRSQTHVAALFGVAVADLRRAIRARRRDVSA